VALAPAANGAAAGSPSASAYAACLYAAMRGGPFSAASPCGGPQSRRVSLALACAAIGSEYMIE